MAALREVFARFGIQVDGAPLKTLDQGVSGVVSKLNALGSTLAAGAVVQGLRSLTTEASDVVESMNVLRETFKEATPDVLRWSETVGTEMGRSATTLQKAAGSFGAFLSPMLGADASKEQIAGMSTALAQLSVDLGSFYNLTDEEAATKVFSGIAGETEAVRRLGIDLTEAGLAAFAKAQNVKKDVKAMTQAEKTELRYQKMLADTTDKTGDAVRTRDQYANSSKAASEAIKDLRIATGRYLLEGAARLQQALERGALALTKVVKETNLVTVALSLAAAWTAKWAAGLIVANAGALALAGGIALAVLALGDLYTLMTGGKSVIGDFLEAFTGDKEASSNAVTAINESVEGLIDNLRIAYEVAKGVFGLLAGESSDEAGKGVVALRQEIEARKKLSDAAAGNRADVKTNPGAPKEAAVRSGNVSAFMGAGGSFEEFKAQRLKGVNSGAFAATDLDRGTFGKDLVTARAGKVQGKAASGKGNTVNNGPVTVQAQLAPGTTAQQAEEIARIAGKEIDKRQRSAHAALREQG